MKTRVKIQTELLAASDAEVETALEKADPVVLRGLLYQLLGDESLLSMEFANPRYGVFPVPQLPNPADVREVRSKAAAYLKELRDNGAGYAELGSLDRLPKSLGLCAGKELASEEVDLWIEESALDPWARSLRWSTNPTPEQLNNFSVIVIGAGMGGLNAAVHLKRAGIKFTVLEKNSGVGGTWHENRYPGARVDTSTRIYSHIYGVDFEYEGAFPAQPEQEKYFNWIADTNDVRGNIQFNTEVSSVTWDDEASIWEVHASGPEGGQTLRTNAIICCVGLFGRPSVPTFEGQDIFEGRICHTARWPSDLDLSGKRVAVIGSGCTGYQILPEIADQAAHSYLFQRTANWVYDTEGYLSPFQDEVAWLLRNVPYWRNFSRFTASWQYSPASVVPVFTVDPDFDDPDAVSPLNKLIREQCMTFLRSKLGTRPDLMEKMTPNYPVMASRPILVDKANGIYDVLLRDDVTLVTDPISQVTPRGIRLNDGTEYPVDVIALATGFRANDMLWPMEVRGRDGLDVRTLWEPDGARAYVGTMLPGFPNFFMLYGPNTNVTGGLGIAAMEEMTTRFALECIAHLITEQRRTIEVSRDAYNRFNEGLDRVESTRVYTDPRAHNYWVNKFGRSSANQPADGRLIWTWLRSPVGPHRQINAEWLGADIQIQPYVGADLIVDETVN